jgi:predicted RNA binding protein YcfA (HicA-like mRNA interferase family)
LPKLPRLNAQEAESLLLAAGFILLRSNGSHRIYFKDSIRVVVPFHAGKVLHPKTVKQVMKAIDSNQENEESE